MRRFTGKIINRCWHALQCSSQQSVTQHFFTQLFVKKSGHPLLGWLFLSIVMSLAGGYWIADSAIRFKAQREEMQELRFTHEQNIRTYQNQQYWLKRIHDSQDWFDKNQAHSFINPPHREMIGRTLEALAKGRVVLKLIQFSPEQQQALPENDQYLIGSQEIRFSFFCQNDILFEEWAQSMARDLPGVVTLVSFVLHRVNGEEQGNLKGELVIRWSFLRFVFSS